MAEFLRMTVTNSVTPKAGAKHELLLNKLASEPTALGVAKFITNIIMNWVTLCCPVKVQLSCSTNSPLRLVC
jgi:hypothetical protein